MKTCPKCAEQIQDDAKVCRFCGRDFTDTGVACPKCTSQKTTAMGWPVFVGTIATAGCLLWIPVVGWVLIPFVGLFGLLMLVVNLAGNGELLKCQDCTHGWWEPAKPTPAKVQEAQEASSEQRTETAGANRAASRAPLVARSPSRGGNYFVLVLVGGLGLVFLVALLVDFAQYYERSGGRAPRRKAKTSTARRAQADPRSAFLHEFQGGADCPRLFALRNQAKQRLDDAAQDELNQKLRSVGCFSSASQRKQPEPSQPATTTPPQQVQLFALPTPSGGGTASEREFVEPTATPSKREARAVARRTGVETALQRLSRHGERRQSTSMLIHSLRVVRRGGAHTEEVAAVVAGFLTHDNWDVRLESVETLGEMGPAAEGVLPLLEEAAADPDLLITEAAKRAIDHIRNGLTESN